jgi:hypothetical protein
LYGSLTDLSAYLVRLRRCTSNSCKIVWFDGSASSSRISEYVVELVDIYLKKSLLIDRTTYSRNVFSGGRVYTDWLERRSSRYSSESEFSSLRQGEPRTAEINNVKNLEKLRLSWNFGFGPFGFPHAFTELLRRGDFNIVPILSPLERLLFRRPWAVRPAKEVTICFRGSRKYHVDAVNYQRAKAIDMLEKMGVDCEAVPYSEYEKELWRAILGFSPFGFGEICFRDFEVFRSGACLVKPSMAHLETFPAVYEEGETYISCAWDLSDLPAIIENVGSFDQRERYLRIGLQGQEVLRKIRHDSFGGVFVKHFRQALNLD